MSDAHDMITCDHCRKQYRWKERYAGRKVRCGCGQVMVMPAQPPSAEPPPAGSADIELAIPIETLNAPRRRMVYGDEHPPANVTAVAQALVDREDDVVDTPQRSLHLPLGVMAAGLVIQLILQCFHNDSLLDGILSFLILTMAQIVLFTPLGVVSMYVTAAWAGIEFGELFSAIGKMAAIMIGGGAVADLLFLMSLDYITGMRMMLLCLFAIQFVCVGIPCAIVYRLDNDETVKLVISIAVTRLLAVYLIAMILN